MRILLVVAASMLFVAGGCGSDDETRPTTAAARPSTEPFGKYQREVTQADLDRTADKRAEGAETAPPGTYRLTLDRGVMQVVDPDGLFISQELILSRERLRLERYIGESKIAFCPEGDGPSSYSWKLDGGKLSLSPENDGCADREAILAGTWTKTS